MRKKVYQMIENALKEITDLSGKRIIKHIDLWNGQTEMPMEEQPFYLPAVFVEFAPVQYSDLLSGRQTAECSLSLRIVTDARKQSLKDAVWSNVALCNLICEKLYGISKPGISALTRVSSSTDTQIDEWIENQETYKCLIRDNTAIRGYDSADVERLLVTTDSTAQPQ